METFTNTDYSIHKRQSGRFSVMYKGRVVGGAETFERAREMAEQHNKERLADEDKGDQE